MNKFVGEMVGDGVKKMWSFTHLLGTMNFVCTIRFGYTHDMGGHVTSTDENTVVVSFKEPLDKDEILVITIIG